MTDYFFTMSSRLKNLSDYYKEEIPDASKMSFGIVVSEWNPEITNALYKACIETLAQNGAKPKNIITYKVPGSFELPAGANILMITKKVDAVICLGCVIQGETKHADYICNAVANGLISLSVKYNAPFIFGVLTPNNMQQAKERAGGKLGNKGVEAAVSAIKMVALKNGNR